MWKVAVVSSLLVVALPLAARAQFPFADPLEESIHSNKEFINIEDVKEIAGVWRGINTIFYAYLNEGYLYDGVSPFNMSCDQALGSGWDYDYYIIHPRAMTIAVDEETTPDGMLGYIIESGFGATRQSAITDYDYANSTLTLQEGDCRKWRPYFDWEVGKTMLLRNIRYYYYPNERGITKFNELEGCVNADVDHPQCFDTSFEIDGGMHTGMVVDTPVFFECIAGPCLDLPFTLDGYVQTQGYIPAWVGAKQDDSGASDAGK